MNTNISSRYRFPTLAAFVVASALVVAGVWVFVSDQGKNMLSTVPLSWLLVLVCAPLVSAGCAARLFHDKGWPRWLAPLATMLAVAQLFVWAFVVLGVLHYL